MTVLYSVPIKKSSTRKESSEMSASLPESTLQTMKLIMTLFIHLKVNFQYDWAANMLIPNLKVCVKQKRDPNINSKKILSSNPALLQQLGGFDLFY